MVSEIVWSKQAEEQFTEILLYFHFKDEDGYAFRLLEKITHTTGLLLTHPYLGFIDPWLISSSKRYRSLIEGHYKITYYIENDRIWIAAIFDTRQSPEKWIEQFK